MKDSKYDHATRVKILMSGLKPYTRNMKESIAKEVSHHRSPADLAESRKLKPMRAATWFDSNRRGGAAKREMKDKPY